jgi:hypothetical protein
LTAIDDKLPSSFAFVFNLRRYTKRTLFNVKRIIGRSFSECAEEIKIMPFTVKEGRAWQIFVATS